MSLQQLEFNIPTTFTVFEGIPNCYRISIRDQIPPLTLKFKLLSAKGDLNVFASFKHTEPTMKNHDFISNKFRMIKINSYRGDNLFISMTSQQGCEVSVTAISAEPNKKDVKVKKDD